MEETEDLYTRTSFFYQTHSRRIIKRVSECYLRDDLGYGSSYDASSGQRRTLETIEAFVALCESRGTTQILVCDTNVVLHNMDVLEKLVTSGNDEHDTAKSSSKSRVLLVFPETTLVECQSNSRVMYDRAADLIRSSGAIYFSDIHHAGVAAIVTTATSGHNNSTINDRNDAKIRATAEFYAQELGDVAKIILLTDDVASRKKLSKTIESFSVSAYIRKHQPDLTDWVAQQQISASTSQINKKALFTAHLDAAELSKGIASGKYHRSIFRRSDPDTAMATVRVGSERVAVQILGEADQNRAVDGDVVAIALHPVDQWMQQKQEVAAATTTDKERPVATGIPDTTAEPTQSQVMNVPDAVALDGDVNYRPTGKVVGIVRRNFGNHCGSIYEHGGSSQQSVAAAHEKEFPDGSAICVFFPVDSRKVPPIIIRTKQRPRLLGQRIVVAMDSWPIDSAHPLGHYVKSIGKVGLKDVETAVILQQHDIPHEPFSASVLACLPNSDFEIQLTPDRTDLRHLPVLSIDPPGCKDIDDALHCIELPNGNYQVGVHIADVTHYVKPGTPIDLEAASRSTSTYLVNKRLDMLPGLLTTDLCSLKGMVDRYAFSVLWEVTPEAEIINVEFHKTLIHSIAALTYQQAQTMIDQPDNSNDIQAGAVKRLASLARKFRKRRIDAGALTLASPEVKFVLDSESLNPTDVQAYALLEANAVVEEFMLLANVTVAKKILRHYPTLSVLRRHPAPSRSMFDSLISKAAVRGLSINIEDSKKLADSLDAAQVESDPYINKLLRILSTRCMSPAQYFCSGEYQSPEWHHYGLAAPVYTHFTSPIRRYADVCVHRLLAAAIEVAPLPPHLSSKSYLHDLAANMNRRHRAAQIAGRDSVQLHTLIFFAGEGAKEETAYVLDVDTTEGKVPSLSVMVPRYGIEGRVQLDVAADDPDLERIKEQHLVRYSSSGTVKWSLQVFDKVRVRLWVRELQDHQRELVIDLKDPETSQNAQIESNKRSLPTETAQSATKKVRI